MDTLNDSESGNVSHASRRDDFWRAVCSTQNKFTLLVVGLAMVVGVLASGITANVNAGVVKRLQNDYCRQTAAGLATKIAHDLQSHDSPQSIAERAVENRPLTFIDIMDTDGNTLATADAKGNESHSPRTTGFTPFTTIGTPQLVQTSDARRAYLDMTYPIQATVHTNTEQAKPKAGKLLGYLRIGFSIDRTLTELNAANDLLVGIAVFLVATVIPVGFMLVRRMLRPINELAGTMAKFADGDQTARCQTHRTDEIARLADAFNTMADKLVQKHDEVTQLNAHLERRVADRTQQLRELAARDPLTGLYNRRHFSESAQRSLAEANRYGSKLALLMADLDNFKQVNDRFGHQTGDDVLKQTAKAMRSQLRSADLIARFGGDEFIALLPQTDSEEAQMLAQRVKTQLDLLLKQNFPHCNVSVSIGIGCLNGSHTDDPDELIRAADIALYDAKTGGKNTIATREVLS